MGQELTGIRYQSKVYPTVQTIMHRVNEETLMMEHLKQNPKKATGVDGVTKSEYDRNAEENIAGLVQRMKKFSYKPQPVRRTYIPKGNGKLRPLGIPSYEDKLVQGVMAGLLAEVYEGRFRESSYGFREGRSAHDVVRIIDRAIMRGKVNYILEADIKGFFDNVNHDWLMKFLEHDIEDKNFLRYIKRFLIAGVMEGTERQESDKGTPQGGLISPVLANVYLHYVLDVWFEDRVRKSLKGEAQYVRYADDFLMMFQYEEDGKAVMEALKERLNKFSLEVAEEKTRILPFGRIKGTPNEDFDFLGFTFYNAKTRKGNYRVGMKTSKKKMTDGEEESNQGMAEEANDAASKCDTAGTKPETARPLRILWSKWKLSQAKRFLSICFLHNISHVDKAKPKGKKIESRKVSRTLGHLRNRASSDGEHLGRVTKGDLKSRMRENRTYGSVRGGRQT